MSDPNLNHTPNIPWPVWAIVVICVSVLPIITAHFLKINNPVERPPTTPSSTSSNESCTNIQEKLSNDGSVYRGQFCYDSRHGTGTLIYSNGDQYSGQFHNDQLHGKGTYIWKNGDRYDGEWLNNKRHGYGVFKTFEGLEKKGLWANDDLVKESP